MMKPAANMNTGRCAFSSLALLTVILFAVAAFADKPQVSSGKQRSSAYIEHASNSAGDAEAGKRLFENNKTLACSNCHRITGMEKSGPNLDGIGDKYSRRDLIEQVLNPSSVIKPGYEQAVVVTKDGKTINGRFERATKLFVRILDATGKQTNIKTTDIEQIEYVTTSLMPDNVADTLTKSQFTDLIAYLESLRFGVKSGLTTGGKNVPIRHLAKPIGFKPIHSTEISFDNPVWCGPLAGHGKQLLVAEHQQAKLWRFSRDDRKAGKELFLDLSEQAYASANQGLMCVALHPNFARNRRYFLEYEIKEDGKVKTLIVERMASDDGLRDSGRESIRLLEVEQPAFNHNGGCIEFGPDGMLYAAFGDGGPQKDPPGHSQNLKELLGSMVRIDVDRKDGSLPYGIPADNPFLKQYKSDPQIRREIWAYGFREPWRFSFDGFSGELWLGDVGQDKFEEVCLVHRGENHGWNVREAFSAFSDEYRRDGATYTDPLFAYEHGLGFSITGGYVYRADPKSSFYGVYIFGDFNTRRVWGLREQNGTIEVRELGTAPGGIASFGVDDRGEILLVSYGGSIYHLDLSQTQFP